MRAQTRLSRSTFRARGVVCLEGWLDATTCDALNQKLDALLAHRLADDQPGSLQTQPDKRPKASVDPMRPSRKTHQLVNAWKASSTFASVVTSPKLGRLVAELAGWDGARLANDQVWVKPPGAEALTMHRDSAYFAMEPPDQVVTVWLALDDMDPEVGPLQHVPCSHRWSDARHGSAQQFFTKTRSRFDLLYDAARRAGIANPETELALETVSVRAGGCAIHDGRVWHGSGRNSSSRPRRGLGIHFVPACARLSSPSGSTLAHRIMAALGEYGCELSPDHFPVVYTRASDDDPSHEHCRVVVCD